VYSIKTFSVFFTVLFLVSCSDRFEHEDVICNCYRTKMKAIDADFDQTIRELEVVFVEEGFLNGTSGTDYVKGISDLSNFIDKGTPVVSQDVKTQLHRLNKALLDFECFYLRFDTTYESMLGRTMSAMLTTNLSGKSNNLILKMTEIIGEEGYEHPFYKAEYFNYLYYLLH